MEVHSQHQEQYSHMESSMKSLDYATQIISSNKQQQRQLMRASSVELMVAKKVEHELLTESPPPPQNNNNNTQMPAIQVSDFEEDKQTQPSFDSANVPSIEAKQDNFNQVVGEMKVTSVSETEVDMQLNSLVKTLEKTRHTTGEAGRKKMMREKARALAKVLAAQGETVKKLLNSFFSENPLLTPPPPKKKKNMHISHRWNTTLP
jgi:hypothetical protein